MGVRADYMWTRGYRMLRSVNVNAPVDGVRPDPLVGNVTEMRSTGERAQDRAQRRPQLCACPSRRIFGNVMYQWANTRNFADSALSLPSDSNNPDADWGPAAQDMRHRAVRDGQLPAARSALRAGLNMQVHRRAGPTTITTGLDDNGDTVFNDRPAGVARNSARGAGQVTADLRLTRSFNLGGLLGGGPEGVPMGTAPPPPAWRRGDAARPRRTWWRRWRRPADGDHGRIELALSPRPLRERPEPVQPHQLQHLHRQPAVAVLRHGDVGGPGAAARGRSNDLVLAGPGLGSRIPGRTSDGTDADPSGNGDSCWRRLSPTRRLRSAR